LCFFDNFWQNFKENKTKILLEYQKLLDQTEVENKSFALSFFVIKLEAITIELNIGVSPLFFIYLLHQI